MRGLYCHARAHAARALLVRGSGLLATEAYLRGCFSVQDEASILVADAVGASREKQ